MQNATLRAGKAALFHDPLKKRQGKSSPRKLIKGLVMLKLVILLTLAVWLQAAAKGHAQSLSLSLRNTGLEKVFAAIEQQSSYRFIYTKEEIQSARPVSITMHNAGLIAILNHCLKDQPLEYTIKEPYVIIKRKEIGPDYQSSLNLPVSIGGRISNEEGEPVAGATITIKGTAFATASNEKGEWRLDYTGDYSTLVISSIGYQTREVSLTKGVIQTVLSRAVNSLDETIVIAYGKTTKRLNTGNVSKVTAEEIVKQPVSNPLAALYGRVPGLEITQTNGLPGSMFTVLIRGRNSLRQGTQPLYIVDGAPFMLATGTNLSALPTTLTQSPLNSLNPADIESIEVLKDADATAIYGSQGANGVILITTKTGKKGDPRININFSTGFGHATRLPELLGTEDYLKMRKEAFLNDGLTPTISTAPDLVSWDSSAYTDWKDYFLGGTARQQSVQASVAGGTESVQYYISGTYFDETTVFPGSKPNKKISTRLQLSQQSANKKFKLSLSTNYSVDKKDLPVSDLTSYIYLPPNAPSLVKEDGSLNWISGRENPMSFIRKEFHSRTVNILSNLGLSYRVIPSILLKVNLSYNTMDFREQSINPISAQPPSPSSPPTGSNSLYRTDLENYMAEPIVEYNFEKGRSKLSVLGGLSFQHRKQTRNDMLASLFTDDDMLHVWSAAPKLAVSSGQSIYRYNAIFGKVNYNYANRYIVSLNARRDGSTRFGPANRFANFGAVGATWIASEENFFKNKLKWVSYAKLRTSYGVTGNDQITDYLYLDLWGSSTTYQYQGYTGQLQQRLFNPYLQWERNRKLEVAVEMGFLKDRIMFYASYYRHRSGNQLLPISLPGQTGFFSLTRNLDALIQNTGLELEFSANLVGTKDLKWSTSFNLTIPRNKLLKYPGLENTGDRIVYIIGESLSVQRKYQYTGVDPLTGVYTFIDLNNNGSLSSVDDYVKIGTAGRAWYGGFSNELSWKSFQLDLLFQFNKQNGSGYVSSFSNAPGIITSSGGNQPAFVLDRWTKPGDAALVQRFTSTSTSAASRAYQNSRSSSLAFVNTSYVRLKNLAVSYSFTRDKWQGKFIITAQNLFTLTKFKGSDPETQSMQSLPPLHMITVGIQSTF